MTFTVAIAGRPNVGKSTLFNRLVGKAMAIVDDTPGVTRDWREGEARLLGLRFRLLDTAGLENQRAKGSIAARTAERTKDAIGQAAVILFMVDGRIGLTDDDKTIAREIRKTGKPVILLVNKCEGPKMPPGFAETAALGFEPVLPVSATHGEGLDDLHELLLSYAKNGEPEDEAKTPAKSRWAEKRAEKKRAALPSGDDDILPDDSEELSLHIAVTGRPNAGKSTLVNSLIGEDRMLTGPEPGLTRDAIPIGWEFRGKPVRLVDTAGLRRRARIDGKLEKLSTHESLRAIRLAHIVILVIDADQPFDKQDYTIGHHVVEEGRALVVAINKWDTVKQKTETLKMIHAKVEASMAQTPGVPVVTISALNKEGLDRLMKEVMRIYEVWNKRISTGQLNRWLGGMQADHPPPIVAGRRVKLRYMTQVKARPPTFALWVNKPVDLPDSYTRFLTNGLRQVFKLEGVPIRWHLRKGENPYEDKKKRR